MSSSLKKPRRRAPIESVIYNRMRWIDRGQGCHAALETIRTAKNQIEETYSISHTRRIVRRLQMRGLLVFAGQTVNGCNIWLLPEKHQQYEAKNIPVCTTRPTHHLWSTDEAQKLVKALPAASSYLVQGYPVCRKIAEDFAEDVVRRAVDVIKATYPGLDGIRHKAALLRDICRKIIDAKGKRAADRRSEPTRQAAELRWEKMPAEAIDSINRLLGKTSAPHPSARPATRPATPAPAPVPNSPAAAAAPAAESDGLTVATQLDRWLVTVRAFNAEGTINHHSGKAANLKKYMGGKVMAELGRDDLAEYIATRRQDGVKEQTIKKELAVLFQAVRDSNLEHIWDASCRRLIRKLTPRDARKPQPLTLEEYQLLRRELDPRRQHYLDLAVYTGARKSELESLQRSDVDLRGGRIHIRGTKTKGSDRTIPLSDVLVPFVRNHGGGKLVEHWLNVNRDLIEACKAAGITRRCPLDLRHTFASWLKQRGVDSFLVAKLMGHRDSKMVEHTYAHLDDESLRRAMSFLPARAPPEQQAAAP